MFNQSVGQQGAGCNPSRPLIGITLADMRAAGVAPESARAWHVTDGVTAVPVGAFAGIDTADKAPTSGNAADLYLVVLGGRICLRYVVMNQRSIGTATSETGPFTMNRPGSVEVVGRVFWSGQIRSRW